MYLPILLALVVTDPDPAVAVRALLTTQAAAWNKADLDGFMTPYWASDDLVFYSGGTVTKGHAAVHARYKKNYQSDGKEMGKLTFEGIEVEILGPDAAMARGTWRVVTTKDTTEGLFTLVLKKLPVGWRIVHDHTSKADTPKKPG